jgi:hypothetical protein
VSIEDMLEQFGDAWADTPSVPPEQAFDRAWCMDVLQRAMRNVKAANKDGDGLMQYEIFVRLKLEPELDGKKPPSHREVAAHFGIREKQVSACLWTMQRRLQRAIIKEIRNYATEEESVAEELAGLFEVFQFKK